jgi:hypothetical protein
MSKPLAAALTVAAIQDISVLDGSIEQVASRGFGDHTLDAFAREIVRLRFEADGLSQSAAVGLLRERGIGDDAFRLLEQSASRAGVSAPFLDPNASRELVHSLWHQAFDLLMQVEALERAVEGALKDFGRDGDSLTLNNLKAERDRLRRLINGDWSKPEESRSQTAH